MTAVAEARALLDQLMGGERNAPLPKGAALPQKRKQDGGDGAMLLLPGKRSKSCYDRDICPLYCAWGVDVYELFVNTKSDIGPNPNKPDDYARQEYLTLPKPEQERLGFEHLLFHKLGELVSSCDRTVQRNTEKLNKELQRQLQKRGGNDYVMDVDEAAVEQLCRNQITLDDKMKRLDEALLQLAEIKKREDSLMSLVASEKEAEVKQETTDSEEPKVETAGGDDSILSSSTDPVPKEEGLGVAVEFSEGEGAIKDEGSTVKPPSRHALELGTILLEKQALVVDLANLISQVSPLQEAVEAQLRSLNHVKSDTTSDKTVCEISGNFMSARDADERIAAHYAGKQYVGWKLVRDKFGELVKQYGKYGPPPPGRGPPPPGRGPPPIGSGGGPPPHLPPPGRGGGEDRGGWRSDDRGGRRGGPPGGGRMDNGGRWERGEGAYDRGGHHDRGRRDPPGGGHGGRDSRGSGGWGRR
jgi:LUC7 N_terminus